MTGTGFPRQKKATCDISAGHRDGPVGQGNAPFARFSVAAKGPGPQVVAKATPGGGTGPTFTDHVRSCGRGSI
jgi:hypothetical protein